MEEVEWFILVYKKKDKELLSNYRLLSISPTLSRFMGAVFCHQLRPILEYHYGPEQHGFRKGHSTVSLLHILEAVISTATTTNKELIIVQIDVAKAFDKVHRDAVQSFATTVIQPIAPEAAKFITEMYKGDEVKLNYGNATSVVAMQSGIRQGDPISPAIFSALLGHILKPLIQEWKRKKWGAIIDPTKPDERVTVLAYADDVTLFAESREQASKMLDELSKALQGINLQLLPEKCSALWTEEPEGSLSENPAGGSENTHQRGTHHPRRGNSIQKRLRTLL